MHIYRSKQIFVFKKEQRKNKKTKSYLLSCIYSLTEGLEVKVYKVTQVFGFFCLCFVLFCFSNYSTLKIFLLSVLLYFQKKEDNFHTIRHVRIACLLELHVRNNNNVSRQPICFKFIFSAALHKVTAILKGIIMFST